jgi:hypothetical protein
MTTRERSGGGGGAVRLNLEEKGAVGQEALARLVM